MPAMRPAMGDRRQLPEGPYTYARRRTREVLVGGVGIGGDNPIRIQSMTTTRTLDTASTVAQTVRLVEAGAELVRITAPTVEDAANLREIRARLRALGIRVPLIADIHFNPRAAIEAAKWVDKVRINPGNYADARVFARREYDDAEYERELDRIEARLLPLIQQCRAHGVAMRIGTNHGSLSDRIMSRFGDTPEGMAESALEFVRICERHGYRDIVLSMKASNPKVMIQAYRLLAARMDAEGMDYPFHLGVTEAGSGVEARVKSAAGIGALLDDGIGDTIRVSLAEEPEAELPVARQLADLYTGERARARLAAVSSPPALSPEEERDPFSYRRRSPTVVRIGQVAVGEGAPKVVADATPALADPSLLDRLFARGAGSRPRPDLLEVSLAGLDPAEAARRLRSLRDALGARALRVPLIVLPAAPAAGLAGPLAEAADGLKVVLRPAGSGPAGAARDGLDDVLALAAARRLPLWIEADVAPEGPDAPRWDRVVEDLLSAAERARAAGLPSLVLGVRSSGHSALIRAARYLAARLREAEAYPIALGAVADAAGVAPLDACAVPLTAPIALGSPLVDGLGDLVKLEAGPVGLGVGESVELAYDCLQAAGARTFKAEIVACPSCGRTLFDLQSTTERIKARTGHLVGVKIAVMGCVVNGPGELADADFGYMGGAPGRVNLYVGRECVERNVPAAEADERLIALIRAHGRWVDPPS